MNPSSAEIRSNHPANAPHIHRYLILAICCLSLLLIGMDVTIVNVALAAIQQGLHASLSGLQWVVDAYTIVLASLLIFSGSMSDRYGRRLVFQVGLAIFALGSLLCSLTQGVGGMIVARALQGLGASMLNPVALSIITHAFPDHNERAKAIGYWGAMMGVSMAVGPVLGGALIRFSGWRSIFWINLPICVAAIALTAKFIPESKGARRRPFDPIGQALALIGLFSITYAIIEGPQDGWGSGRIVGLFTLAALALVLFFLVEPRLKSPLIDPRFFGSGPFSSAILLALITYSSFAGFLFLNALYLQQARGFSAFHTGLCMLPFAAIIVAAPFSGWTVGRFGPRFSQMTAGLCFLASTAILTQLTLATPLTLLLLAYGLFGVGLGMVNPAITNNAVSGMPLGQAGVAGGIASTSRQVGTAMGVALAGTIVNVGRANGFIAAARPFWWAMMTGSAILLFVAWAATTAWSHRSAARVAARFEGMSAPAAE